MYLSKVAYLFLYFKSLTLGSAHVVFFSPFFFISVADVDMYFSSTFKERRLSFFCHCKNVKMSRHLYSGLS